MKKIKAPFALMLAAVMVPVITFAANGNGNGNASAASDNSQAVNGNSSSGNSSSGSSSSTAGNEVQTQTQTQNQGEDSQIQTQTSTELQEKINEVKPQYSPRSEQAQSHMSIVAIVAEALVRAADRISDPGIGDQIREIARNQSQNQDKINQDLDKIQQRSAFAHFFVGANYSAIKDIQGMMEQNREQIRELAQIASQINNEGDKTELSNQISALLNLQTSLQDQLNDLTSGFSLFGWLNRWMRGVTI
ncbi:MAG: hypothetical protein WC451_00640 [Patescibacteria group bacterium]